MNDLQISPPIEGHWRSLQTVLKEIHKVSVLESFVSHPELGYNGIVDCVAQYRFVLLRTPFFLQNSFYFPKSETRYSLK